MILILVSEYASNIYRGTNIRGSEVFQYGQKGQSMIEMHAYYREI